MDRPDEVIQRYVREGGITGTEEPQLSETWSLSDRLITTAALVWVKTLSWGDTTEG